MEKVVIPDQFFWYTLATLMAIALIWVIRSYVGKIDAMLQQLTASVNELITITKVHETEITHLKENVKNIQENKVVRYRNGG